MQTCCIHTHTLSLMTADNYARSVITAAGIRLAQKLIICLDGRAVMRPLIWDTNEKKTHSSSMLCESESGIVQRDGVTHSGVRKLVFVRVYSLNS